MKQLTQSTTDKKIWGVAGGIASYFGISSLLVPAAFLFLAIIVMDPLTIGILYVAIAFIIDEDEPASNTLEVIPVEEYKSVV